MSKTEYDPAKALGDGILNLDRQELCALVARLCLRITAEAGPRRYRGGIYPENISLDEDGTVAIGPAKMEKWKWQELEFIAPELYWHGESGPASDVYSLGLLLIYGLNHGKLPFATGVDSGQLSRMSGKAFSAPEAAGKRLGAIIEKATRFKAADRYQNVEELQVMLESCLENKYLTGAPGASTVFQKSTEELSEMERMMLSIIENSDAGVDDVPQPAPEDGVIPIEVLMAEPPEPAPEKKPPEPDEEMQALLEEFNAPLTEEEAEYPVEDGVEGPIAQLLVASDDDVRVYRPREKRDPNGQPIPVLTVEHNPELAPVVVQQRPHSSLRTVREAEREQQMAQEVHNRRLLPWIVLLSLCLLLIVGAGIANVVLRNRASRGPNIVDGPVTSDTEPEQVAEEPVSEAETEVTVPPVVEPSYQVFVEDVSWTQARDRCREMGGHLAVITSREEFQKVTELAQQAGITHLWIGCHREDGKLVWETDEDVLFDNWAVGEPSYYDSYDGVPEDYIMVWYLNGAWTYNDSRNDPVADYPGSYSGTVGYVCEFGT